MKINFPGRVHSKPKILSLINISLIFVFDTENNNNIQKMFI